MIDGAILIAAQELGLFARHGVSVRLHRELGWATIREKLVHEELDAAHAPASMAFAIHCGIASVPRPCLTGIIMSLNGSAITLSNELWKLGVRDAASLKSLVERERGRRIFSFGAVLGLSTQNYNLRKWLRSGGIDPDRDVRIPVIPSPLVHQTLIERYLDGFCVAEPWNSLAVAEGAGWIAATSAEIDPGHPEKILLVLEKFAEERSGEHLAMIAALIEASIFCDNPANRKELVRILSQPRYIDVASKVLESSLLGPLQMGRGESDVTDFIVFHRSDANIPTRAQGRRVFNEIRSVGQIKACRGLRTDIIGRIFREDLYLEASKQVGLRQAPDKGDWTARKGSKQTPDLSLTQLPLAG